MKLFTKRFINKIVEDKEHSTEKTLDNARRAEKKLGLPYELYLEFAKKAPNSKLIKSIKDPNMAFFAGLLVGWAEKNNKIN